MVKSAGKPEEVLVALDSLKGVCDIEGNPIHFKKWHHLWAMHCIYLAKYDEALKHSQEGMLRAQANPKDTFNAIFTNQLGVLHYSIGQKESAMKYYKSSAELAKTFDMQRLEGVTYNNIGGIYTEWEQFDSADLYLRKALDIWKVRGQAGIGLYLHTYRILATNAEYDGKPEKALQMFKDMLRAAKIYKDTAAMGRTYVFMSHCEADLGLTDSAVFHAKKGLDIFDADSNQKDNLVTSLSSLTYAYEMSGKYQDALAVHKELNELQKDMFNKDLEKQISLLEAEFNTETERQQRRLAEAETEAANQKIRIYGISIASVILLASLFGLVYWQRQKRKLAEKDIAIQKERLAALLEGEERERTRIARELHDGVSQLLGALKMNLHASGVDDPQSLDLLDNGIQEIRSISHNLLPKQLSNQGLIAALQSMVDLVKGSDTLQVSLTYNENSEPRDELTRVNIYRICQELLTNAIKHAKATKIQFDVKFSNSVLTLTYSDNGVGMSQTQVAKAEGIGWKNMLSRVELLGGKMTHISSEQGLSLRFNFPHPPPA